jgi:hypothetical protein
MFFVDIFDSCIASRSIVCKGTIEGEVDNLPLAPFGWMVVKARDSKQTRKMMAILNFDQDIFP